MSQRAQLSLGLTPNLADSFFNSKVAGNGGVMPKLLHTDRRW